MGHAQIKNNTPFAFDSTFATDENGRPVLVCVIKATYALKEDGQLDLFDPQVPINMIGETWGEPGKSSYKYEPESAFFKPATDVVLIGHAYAPHKNTTEVLVRLRVGSLDKTVRVIGDREWVRRFGFRTKSSPKPFEKIPLVYERSFGGWDRSRKKKKHHPFERRNPVGSGFRSWLGKFEKGIKLPNLEDPHRPLRWYRRKPPPAGFGFISPDWKPRSSYGGTYDANWIKNRMPLLPKDFDRRFFNAASAGLVSTGYLLGGEPVSIEHVSPNGPVQFHLPSMPAPDCCIKLIDLDPVVIRTHMDTVIINTDENILMLLWRGHHPLRTGLHDVEEIHVQPEKEPEPEKVS